MSTIKLSLNTEIKRRDIEFRVDDIKSNRSLYTKAEVLAVRHSVKSYNKSYDARLHGKLQSV